MINFIILIVISISIFFVAYKNKNNLFSKLLSDFFKKLEKQIHDVIQITDGVLEKNGKTQKRGGRQ